MSWCIGFSIYHTSWKIAPKLLCEKQKNDDVYSLYCLSGVSYYAVLLSEWVSVSITIESQPPTNCANFDPMLPNLWNFPGAGVFRSRVVNYDILRNNRCSKLHAVLDCLFFSLKRHSLLRGEHNGIITPNLANRHMPEALFTFVV